LDIQYKLPPHFRTNQTKSYPITDEETRQIEWRTLGSSWYPWLSSCGEWYAWFTPGLPIASNCIYIVRDSVILY